MGTNPNEYGIGDILAMVGRGDLRRLLDKKGAETLATLYKLSKQNPQAKIKGEVSVKLSFKVEDGIAEVIPEISCKVPQKETVQKTVYWLTDQGQISTQHPQQENLPLAHQPSNIPSNQQ